MVATTKTINAATNHIHQTQGFADSAKARSASSGSISTRVPLTRRRCELTP